MPLVNPGVVVQDEGAFVGAAPTINIAGAGASVAVAGGVATVTVPGGGGNTPTGTGFTHITAGVQDAAAKLVDTADVNNDQVTNTKLANVATATFKGRTTAGTGDPEDLSVAQATALLNLVTTALQGLVPASGGGTDKVFRSDLTWTTALVGLSTVTTTDFVNDTIALNRAGTGDRRLALEQMTSDQDTNYRKRRNTCFMDFESSSNWPLGDENTGTGSSAVGIANISNANQIGIRQLNTGTTVTGSAGVQTHTSAILLGNGTAVIEASLMLPTLSTGTERYIGRFGFIDNFTGDAVDGVYFEYEDSLSANWRVCTSSNSTRTKTNTTTAVAANTYVTLRIVVNAAGTSASFFVDGTEASGSPITTNIPTGAGRETGWGYHIVKSIGTTNSLFRSDWMFWDIDLTTART